MLRVVTHDHRAALVKDGMGTQGQPLLQATGPIEAAYLHLVATLLRKVLPQSNPSVVGIVRKVPTGYAFDCRGIWEDKKEARRFFDQMSIPPEASGKLMVCWDGSVMVVSAEPDADCQQPGET